jgi:hypothetical protein
MEKLGFFASKKDWGKAKLLVPAASHKKNRAGQGMFSPELSWMLR